MRITKTAKIRERTKKTSDMSEGPTRTASFMKITSITKIVSIRKDLWRSQWELQKLQKFPKGIKKALRKPSWRQSGPIRIAKIANIMIIRKTGTLANFQKKLWDQKYIKDNCLRNKGYNLTKKHHQWWKTCISALSLCNNLFHLSFHLSQTAKASGLF